MEPSRILLCLLVGMVLPSLCKSHPRQGNSDFLAQIDGSPVKKANLLALWEIIKLDDGTNQQPEKKYASPYTVQQPHPQQQQQQQQQQQSLSNAHPQQRRKVFRRFNFFAKRAPLDINRKSFVHDDNNNNNVAAAAEEEVKRSGRRSEDRLVRADEAATILDNDNYSFLRRLLLPSMSGDESRSKRWVCSPMPCCRYDNQC